MPRDIVDPLARVQLAALLADGIGRIAEGTARLWAHELLEGHALEVCLRAVRAALREVPADRVSLAVLLEHVARVERAADPGVVPRALPAPAPTSEREHASRVACWRALLVARRAGVLEDTDAAYQRLWRQLRADDPEDVRAWTAALAAERGVEADALTGPLDVLGWLDGQAA